MKTRRLRQNPPDGGPGYALVLVLFIMMIVSGLSFGLLQEGMAAQTSMRHHESNLRALEIAEAGLVRAGMELRAEKDLDGGGIGNAVGTFAGGNYEVTIRDDPASPTRWILTSRAQHGHSARQIEVGVRRRTGKHYAEALFSVESLPVSNVLTDGYDSRIGPYATQAVNVDGHGAYALPVGSLGSNADIELDGSAVVIRGDAIPGPDQAVIESGSPTVTGDLLPRTFELELPPPPLSEFQDALTNNDNAGLSHNGNGNRVRYRANSYSLSVAGNTTITWPGGTYFFKDIVVQGGSTVNFSGPVKIYLTGSLTLGSDTQFAAPQPSDVQIIAHPYALPNGPGELSENTQVDVNGGSTVSWAFYGPSATLDISGGNSFFGAAIADRVELQGSNEFHYDIALGEGEGQWLAMLERLYWRDLVPPAR